MYASIIEYLRNHPGARKREIARSIGVWVCDGAFLNAMYVLEDTMKVIRKELYSDPANMEFYDMFYLVEGKEETK